MAITAGLSGAERLAAFRVGKNPLANCAKNQYNRIVSLNISMNEVLLMPLWKRTLAALLLAVMMILPFASAEDAGEAVPDDSVEWTEGAANITRDLTLNDEGDDVSALQTALTDLCYYSGDVTGRYGEATKTAVEDFQRDFALAVTGMADKATQEAIYAAEYRPLRLGCVGEDVRQAQIRLMEHLRNHHDERSMLVLRPADGEETVTAWKLAIEEHRPVALILSRQNIKNLPALNHSRREEAAQLSKGAYIVVDAAKPAVVMLASGSEVATLVEGAELLSKEGIAVRIVSVPSEGLFRDQPKSYQQTVLPQGVVRYGLTSGLPVTLLGLVGENGMIHGLDHFGYSAPYKVLDEKFGYNGQTVYEEVKKLIGK